MYHHLYKMPSQTWILFRIVSLAGSSICCILSGSQIWNVSKRRNQTKMGIHFSCFGMIVMFLLFSIDWYVFGVLPRWVTSFFESLIWTGQVSVLCFFMHGHFQAHYFLLGDPIPPWIPWILLWMTILVTSLNLITIGLVYYYQNVTLMMIHYLTHSIFYVTCLGLERLVYLYLSDILNTKTVSNPIPRRGLTWQNNEQMQKGLVNIKVIHVGVILFCLLFLVLGLWNSYQVWSHPVWFLPQNEPDANSYLNLSYWLFWGLFTWWAWVPNDKQNKLEEGPHLQVSIEKDDRISPHVHTPSHFISNPLHDIDTSEPKPILIHAVSGETFDDIIMEH